MKAILTKYVTSGDIHLVEGELDGPGFAVNNNGQCGIVFVGYFSRNRLAFSKDEAEKQINKAFEKKKRSLEQQIEQLVVNKRAVLDKLHAIKL